MRKVIALTVFVACVATASTSAGAERKAVLRLVDRDPLTVKGEGFKPRERLRVHAAVSDPLKVSAYAPEAPQRVIRASATGTFRVVFAETALDRCGTVHVVAIRSQGNAVVLKPPPQPMCMPNR
jgi:hypothetical protein